MAKEFEIFYPYQYDGHYVDLTGWVEDLDGNIMQELSFTVMLPSPGK